jgi:hypothetical protein
MEFINYQQINKDKEAVNQSLQTMSKLYEAIKADGLKVSITEILSIACGKLSLTKVYESEALHRSKGSPQYVIEEAASLATNRANRLQSQVNECRKYGVVIARLPEKNFSLTDQGIIYSGNLEKDLTVLHTQKLNQKQENLVNELTSFKRSVEKLNISLSEINFPKIEVKIPFFDHSEKPDLEQILRIDFDDIEQKRKNAIAAGIRSKELRELNRKRLENLVPKDLTDGNETRTDFINRMLAADPTGSKYSDEFIKNLIAPSKGSFVNKSKASPVASIYEDGRPVR